MEKENKNKGITLIALVITIIVLLILAGVTIATLTGDNGLLQKATKAKEATIEGEIEEKIKLVCTEWQTAKLTGTTENAIDFIKNRLNSSIGNVEDVSVDDSALTVTINKNNEDKTYYYNIKSGTTKQIELAKNSNNKNDSYVGCYADIDEDGIVDGVIFADLLTGSIKEEQKWGTNDYGTYTLPTDVTTNNVKSYYISQKKYQETFGTKDVLSPISTNGKERFYIMSLNDVTSSAKTDGNESENYPAYTSYYWYLTALLTSRPSDTSIVFGSGKTNTDTVMDRWNKNVWGEQNNKDLWKHIQAQVNKGWFLPSKEELTAFVNELGITSNNYSEKGLKRKYWSSSLRVANDAWDLELSENKIYLGNLNYDTPVRLATIF